MYLLQYLFGERDKSVSDFLFCAAFGQLESIIMALLLNAANIQYCKFFKQYEMLKIKIA